MIKKNIIPFKNMQLQGVKVKKDKPILVRFKSERNFKSLLAFGNFKEAGKDNSKTDADDNSKSNVEKADEPSDKDNAQTTECDGCGTYMVLTKENQDSAEYVCPICSSTKTIEKDGTDNQNEDISSSSDTDEDTLDENVIGNTHKEFECPYENCDKTFKTERGMKMHISRSHE